MAIKCKCSIVEVIKGLLISTLLVLLASCSTPKSPVSSRNTIDQSAESERLGGRRITIVQRGDTLYSIAFENSLDVNQLAAWNGMTDVTRLQIGQRLRLTKPINFTNNTTVKQNKPVVIQRETVTTGGTSTQSRKPLFQQKPTAQKPTAQKPTAQKTTTTAVNWQWPIRGQVLQKFSIFAGNKGINIAAKPQQQVRASAAGKVVYQGSGIKGYGKLVIIKHNQTMLSAY